MTPHLWCFQVNRGFVLRLLTNRSGLVATVFIASFEYCGDETVLFIAA
jgi:hypothetical protein